MKKMLKLLIGSAITSVLVCLYGVSAYAIEIDGLGTDESPYVIKNENQLIAITTNELPDDASYILNNDIKLITKSWTPIGTNSENGFSGKFNGNGHTISNLTIGATTNTTTDIGLFSKNEGTISNLNVEVSSIIGNKYTGGIVGQNNGLVSGCKITGTISADNSYNTDNSLGGAVGSNYGNVINVISNVTLKDGNTNTGGVVGYSEGTIERCEYTGVANDLDTSYFGGIVGYSKGDVTACSNSGVINTYLNYLGGVVGYADSGTISLSSNKSDISSTTTFNSYIGGLIGYNNNAEVSNCYSIGDVSCSNTSNYNTYVGGFMGYNKSEKYIKNTYCISRVSGKTASAFANGQNTLYVNCFYNKTVQNTAEVGAFGLTDDEMRDTQNFAENFTFWDFVSTWGIDTNINNGYPYLLSLVNPVTGVTISDDSLNLSIGEAYQLTAEIQPTDATNKGLSWISSNSNIVSVDDNGNLIAKKLGSATVSAVTADGGFTANCDITVVNNTNLDETLLFKVDDFSTIRGQKIKVPIRLLVGNSVGISSINFDVSYDTDYLTPVEDMYIQDGELFSGLKASINEENGIIHVSGSSSNTAISSGIIGYIEFTVNPKTEIATSKLTISVKELKATIGTIQKNLKSIAFDGTVTINNFKYGDVDGNNVINAADASLILQKVLDSTFILPIER